MVSAALHPRTRPQVHFSGSSDSVSCQVKKRHGSAKLSFQLRPKCSERASSASVSNVNSWISKAESKRSEFDEEFPDFFLIVPNQLAEFDFIDSRDHDSPQPPKLASRNIVFPSGHTCAPSFPLTELDWKPLKYDREQCQRRAMDCHDRDDGCKTLFHSPSQKFFPRLRITKSVVSSRNRSASFCLKDSVANSKCRFSSSELDDVMIADSSPFDTRSGHFPQHIYLPNL